MMKKFISIFLILIIISGGLLTAFANKTDINEIINDTASYLYKTVKEPQIASVGGEWTILALSRSGLDIPEDYYNTYYENVEKYVREHKGILHDKKYTEYSRVIIALTAIGKNPENVAGYNLLMPLADYENTIWQGVNGAIWALIALDCGNYDIPFNNNAKIQATREMYINHILKEQTSDGGWALAGYMADPNVTGMALQALSKYQDNERVKVAIGTALNLMSKIQDDKGGFSTYIRANSESCVQMLVALLELGISVDDVRFVKNGYTILDNLLGYYNKGYGFTHEEGENTSNLMATEQALYGLVSVKRVKEGKSSLYRMSDVIYVNDSESTTIGLRGKHEDVKKMNIINHDKTFSDIVYHKNKHKIEELAKRGIINGKNDNIFDPDSTITRAEFATIIAKGLGLSQKNIAIFKDVTVNDWFFGYVGTGYYYGIIKGVSENEFNPNGTITREEAAVMVERAAKLCGMDTKIETFEARNVLAEFFDYVKASDWSISSLAFCYKNDILSKDVMEIKPKEAVTRAEIAGMLYNMLYLAELI